MALSCCDHAERLDREVVLLEELLVLRASSSWYGVSCCWVHRPEYSDTYEQRHTTASEPVSVGRRRGVSMTCPRS